MPLPRRTRIAVAAAMTALALPLAAAIALNIVVIDHHMMRSEPPTALAVVNPNRP